MSFLHIATLALTKVNPPPLFILMCRIHVYVIEWVCIVFIDSLQMKFPVKAQRKFWTDNATTNSWIKLTMARQSIWLNCNSVWTHTHTPIDKLDRLYTQPASLFLDKCSIMCLKQWGVHNSRGFPPTSCPVNESLRANYGHSNVTHITLNTQTHTVPVSHQVKLLMDKQQ